MSDEPVPPAALPSGLTDECRSLSADRLQKLARLHSPLPSIKSGKNDSMLRVSLQKANRMNDLMVFRQARR
jgi:hypothetical protein